MVYERIRFEIILDDIDSVDIRTKSLVIFGKFVNVDPSCKLLPYYDQDMKQFPPLEKTQNLPQDVTNLSKYLSAPMVNPQGKKLLFHARFRTVMPLQEMKMDPAFMEWLKQNKIYTSIMTIDTTLNTRAGFFIGKGSHITTTAAFTEWICSRLHQHTNDCPDFQLNSEGIGHHEDASTKSCAIVVIRATTNVHCLCQLLDTIFHAKSNYPFTPFPVMYNLDIPTQTALYKSTNQEFLEATFLKLASPDLTILIPRSRSAQHFALFEMSALIS